MGMHPFSLALNPAQELPPSLKSDWDAFRQVRLALTELDTLERTAEIMERELEHFLESYYARVLPLTQRLERLRYRKAHGVFPSAVQVESLTTFHSGFPDSLRKHKKLLFRKLAKRCHPDAHGAQAPVTIMEVYQAGTIGALWLLELRCECDAREYDSTRLDTYLQEQGELIGKIAEQTRLFIQKLTTSAPWLLKERVFEAALAGNDLVETIQRRIEKQIAALQQHFTIPRKSIANVD